jgi:hypothetical protein
MPPAQGDIAEIGSQPNRGAFMADIRAGSLKHDPEKCEAIFPRDKRETRLRGDHAQTMT